MKLLLASLILCITSAAFAQSTFQCPSGYIPAGDVRDKYGTISGHRCVKDVSRMSQPPTVNDMMRNIRASGVDTGSIGISNSEISACLSPKFNEMQYAPGHGPSDLVPGVKRMIQQYGGVDEAVRASQEGQQQAQGSSAGVLDKTGGVHSQTQALILAEALIETLQCLQNSKSSPPSGFRSPGSVGSTAAIDDLLRPNKRTNCTELAKIRDKDLIQMYDTALDKYNIYNGGVKDQFDLAKKAAKLMDDEWWAGKTGAQVATEVRVWVQMVKASIAPYVPEWVAVGIDLGQDITERTIKSWIDKDAERLEETTWKDIVKKSLDTFGGAGGGITTASWEYGENHQGMDKYRLETQYQITRMIMEAQKSVAKAKQSKQKMEDIQDMITAIDKVCGSYTPITPPR